MIAGESALHSEMMTLMGYSCTCRASWLEPVIAREEGD
jgi:hypothetical protein